VTFRLSPSDLTFNYESCRRCFYLKVVRGIAQPSIPLPSIFSQIGSLLKNHYDGKRTSELHPDLPPGIVSHGEKRVRSQTIRLTGHDATCSIRGRFDIVVTFDDGTYGVIDFKTSRPGADTAWVYSRQLHAYAYALEHPAPGALALSPVTKLGLLYFYPSSVSQDKVERISYDAEITWIEVAKDEHEFLRFIDEAMDVLELREPPEHSPACLWCRYVGSMADLTDTGGRG